jgi:hypothetical protein
MQLRTLIRSLLLLLGSLLALAATAAQATDSAGPAAGPAAGNPGAALQPGADPPPSAARIAERNVQARGGAAAWRAVRSISFGGEMEAGGTSHALLPVVLDLMRPHMSRVELQFQGKTSLQVFDGSSGWKLRPYLGRGDVEPYTAEEAADAAAELELDGPLVDYQARGTRITLEATEVIEGQQTFRLKAIFRDGRTRKIWIDAKTYLEVKMEGTPRRVDGRLHAVESWFRDFRPVEGMMVPYVVETAVEGIKQRHRMVFTEVKVNPPLQAAMFSRQALILAGAGTP